MEAKETFKIRENYPPESSQLEYCAAKFFKKNSGLGNATYSQNLFLSKNDVGLNKLLKTSSNISFTQDWKDAIKAKSELWFLQVKNDNEENNPTGETTNSDRYASFKDAIIYNEQNYLTLLQFSDSYSTGTHGNYGICLLPLGCKEN